MRNQISTATVDVILYKSKVLANGEHPLMLRITKDGKRSYSAIGISCAEKLWDTKRGLPKKHHPDKSEIEDIITKKLAAFRKQLLEYKTDEKDFTASSLIKTVKKPLRNITVFKFFEEVIERLKVSKKIGYAHSNKDTLLSLKQFTQSQDLKFSELDFHFLIRYETFLRAKGLKDTTMAVYFRTLRSIFNKAIKENVAKENDYPFKDFKLSRFKLATKKRAIRKSDIKAIEKLNLATNSYLSFARQVFLFSYYGFGINFIDIANLTWENVNEGRVSYVRKKTGKLLQFKLVDPAVEIIEYFRTKTGGSKDNYIFPILNKEFHKTPTQIDNRIHKVNGYINNKLKEIGEMAEIDIPLTTYVARHTSATTLKRNGVATSIITEGFGHHSEAVTNIYLASFENEDLDEAINCLL